MSAYQSGQPLLEVRNLCVDYGAGPDAVHAVVDADLVLHRGEVLGLAGESGSGKSTLAYAITRLLRAPGMITGGSVGYHPKPGTTVDLLAANEGTLRVLRWSQISVVMQSAMNALNPVLSIGAQLTDVLQAHQPDLGQAARTARAGELLAMVGINADRLGSYPHELSGGMRQRVMIAMESAISMSSDRSWVMNRTAKPSRSRSPASSSRISRWVTTSRAVVGSSMITSCGSSASAMAIMTRWRMPPDSSCGYCRSRRAASLTWTRSRCWGWWACPARPSG